MATLYLTFGPTHSGKTTFGKKLHEVLLSHTKVILVDNDSIDAYLKDNFNNLRTDPEILQTRTPTNPDLRLRIPQLVTDYALTEHYSVIVTASHSKKVIRMKYHEIAKRYNAAVVLLIFRISKEVVIERLKHSNRPSLSLKEESFDTLYQKQQTLLEQPAPDELLLYNEVVEVDEHNQEAILAALAKLSTDLFVV